MNQPDAPGSTNPNAAIECICKTICGCLLPFFLSAADDNVDVARAAILELINAYKATSVTELDLAGRVVAFSIVALDNLRLSMTPEMSDSKILRYRSNAVALSRASEQARQILRALQDNRETTRKLPRPAVAPGLPPDQRPSTPRTPEPPRTAPAFPPPIARPDANAIGISAKMTQDIETMQREARNMLEAFSKNGAGGGSVIQMIPDPATMIAPAVRSALNPARRSGP